MSREDIERRVREVIEDFRQRLTIEQFQVALQEMANQALAELGGNADQDEDVT